MSRKALYALIVLAMLAIPFVGVNAAAPDAVRVYVWGSVTGPDGSTGVPGALVELFDPAGNVIGSSMTVEGAGGNAAFGIGAWLRNGTYSVVCTPPTGGSVVGTVVLGHPVPAAEIDVDTCEWSGTTYGPIIFAVEGATDTTDSTNCEIGCQQELWPFAINMYGQVYATDWADEFENVGVSVPYTIEYRATWTTITDTVPVNDGVHDEWFVQRTGITGPSGWFATSMRPHSCEYRVTFEGSEPKQVCLKGAQQDYVVDDNRSLPRPEPED